MISSVVKNSWNWNFAKFRDLLLIGSHRRCSIKKCVLKNFAIFIGKHLCQSLFLSCHFIEKETLVQRFSCEFSKIFKNTSFTQHLWMTASILQQLLALYFAIIYNWQLPSSEKSLVGKKIIHISQGFYRFRFLFFIVFIFFLLFGKSLFTLSVTQSFCATLSSQPFCWFGDT